jgi:hypothetical protein
MEDLTPVHEFSQTVDFYRYVFGGIDTEVERLENPDFTIIQCLAEPPLAVISTRIEEYAAQHEDKTARVLYSPEQDENVRYQILTGCDPAGKFFIVHGPDFYNPPLYSDVE